jgi:hypothetical protein
MIITTKSEDKPDKIELKYKNDSLIIKVVNEVVLLGITLDEKLRFPSFVKELTKKINKKLYSFKNLFFLYIDLKLQFFKTFILPHFDYCSSLIMYLDKTAIRKIISLYNSVLFKLLKLEISHLSELAQNMLLKRYGLMSCMSRFFIRMAKFVYRIINSNYLSFIKNKLILSTSLNTYNLRSKETNDAIYYQTNCKTKHGQHCCSIFITKFVNTIVKDTIFFTKTAFNINVSNNLTDYAELFLSLF